MILGLGRFGSAVGKELVASGIAVLGVDISESAATKTEPDLTHVAIADTTNIQVLKQLSVGDAERVVIGIGHDLAASVLTASSVVDLGVPNIWAKADNAAHAKILKQIGVHHIVLPERDTGRRVAHLISGELQEFVEFDSNFAMVKLAPPLRAIGRPIGEAPQGVTIIAIRPDGESFYIADPTTVLKSGDLIIAAGNIHDLERFAAGK